LIKTATSTKIGAESHFVEQTLQIIISIVAIRSWWVDLFLRTYAELRSSNYDAIINIITIPLGFVHSTVVKNQQLMEYIALMKKKMEEKKAFTPNENIRRHK